MKGGRTDIRGEVRRGGEKEKDFRRTPEK